MYLQTFLIMHYVTTNVESQCNTLATNATPSGCVSEVCHIKGILYIDDLYVTGLD